MSDRLYLAIVSLDTSEIAIAEIVDEKITETDTGTAQRLAEILLRAIEDEEVKQMRTNLPKGTN